METLSEFLTGYLKEHLFNGTSLDKPETFDDQVKRVIHEGIFMYRKLICAYQGIILPDSKEGRIRKALMIVEDEKIDKKVGDTDTGTYTR